jgi:hypothetical protein
MTASSRDADMEFLPGSAGTTAPQAFGGDANALSQMLGPAGMMRVCATGGVLRLRVALCNRFKHLDFPSTLSMVLLRLGLHLRAVSF